MRSDFIFLSFILVYHAMRLDGLEIIVSKSIRSLLWALRKVFIITDMNTIIE